MQQGANSEILKPVTKFLNPMIKNFLGVKRKINFQFQK